MKQILATAAALTLATAAGAAEMSDHDANADGVLSPKEFAAAFEDLDPAIFTVVDRNEDGMIDPAEYAAATAEDGPLATN